MVAVHGLYGSFKDTWKVSGGELPNAPTWVENELATLISGTRTLSLDWSPDATADSGIDFDHLARTILKSLLMRKVLPTLLLVDQQLTQHMTGTLQAYHISWS